MVYYGFRATETEPPEDDGEFDAAVIRALEDMRAHGSQTFTVRQIFHVAEWRRNHRNEKRVSLLIKRLQCERVNRKHYTIPQVIK